jgi:hypothetical protein
MTVRSQHHLADKNLNYIVKWTGVSFATQQPNIESLLSYLCWYWQGELHTRVPIGIVVWTDWFEPVTVKAEVGRDSGCVRTGGLGDRILVGARFSTPVQTGPGDISWGKSAGACRPPTHPHIVPSLSKSRTTFLRLPWHFVAHSRVKFTLLLLPFRNKG